MLLALAVAAPLDSSDACKAPSIAQSAQMPCSPFSFSNPTSICQRPLSTQTSDANSVGNKSSEDRQTGQSDTIGLHGTHLIDLIARTVLMYVLQCARQMRAIIRTDPTCHTYHAVTGEDEDGNDFDELNEEFQRAGDDEGEHGDSKFHDRRCLPG